MFNTGLHLRLGICRFRASFMCSAMRVSCKTDLAASKKMAKVEINSILFQLQFFTVNNNK